MIQSFATGYQSALWLPGHRPGVPGRERLFCFPHAGGGSAAFHPWVAAFPMFDVCAVEYRIEYHLSSVVLFFKLNSTPPDERTQVTAMTLIFRN